MVGREGDNNRLTVKHIYQLKLGVRERDLAGRGVRAGKRCHQLAVGVRDRVWAGRGKQQEAKPVGLGK